MYNKGIKRQSSAIIVIVEGSSEKKCHSIGISTKIFDSWNRLFALWLTWYGCERWTLKSILADEDGVKSFEMKIGRQLDTTVQILRVLWTEITTNNFVLCIELQQNHNN